MLACSAMRVPDFLFKDDIQFFCFVNKIRKAHNLTASWMYSELFTFAYFYFFLKITKTIMNKNNQIPYKLVCKRAEQFLLLCGCVLLV